MTSASGRTTGCVPVLASSTPRLPGATLAARKFIAGEADEPRDEDRGRPVVDIHRRADLVGDAGVHDDQPVGQRHRLDLVVRDVDRRDGELALQALDLEPHLHAQLGIEVGERLVEQEDRRLAYDGAAHRDPLALAAGELARQPLEQLLELERLGRLAHAPVDVVLGQLPDLQAVGHVPVHAHVRIERVVLEHHRDVAVLGLEVVDHRDRRSRPGRR